MANTITDQAKAGKYADLNKRLLFLFLAVVVFRLGTHIPVPGIDPDQLQKMFAGNGTGILNMFNMFSGGALSRMSVFALGIMPYISTSIIMQLATVVYAPLEQLKKEGEAGRRQITKYTRWFTVVLATFQAYGIAVALESQGVVISKGIVFELTAVISLVTGTMFLMWLGEQITERGIGNGISILIFAGIVAGLPSALASTGQLISNGTMHPTVAILIAALVISVTWLVVFVERAQRKITVNYAKRQVGNKVYGGVSSHLPLKLNMAGVIPPIFASSIILLPATLSQWFGNSVDDSTLSGKVVRAIKDFGSTLAPGQPVYILLYALAIVFFCFFYTALVFNSRETADNLKRSGAMLPGIRPGEQTSRYIDKILMRLTAVGAVYITVVCLVPEFLTLRFSVPFYFGGTSLLIIVVVVIDFITQVQSSMMSQNYEGLIKKNTLKGQK
jgi:preprotein translocase subunit SecY